MDRCKKIVLIAIHATKIARMRYKSYMCVAMSPCNFEFCTDKINFFPLILFVLIFLYLLKVLRLNPPLD